MTAEQGSYRPATAWVTLALLFIAYNLSMLDRMVIGLLVEPIKASLQVSDTSISLLQGLAFLLFYSIAGLPLGILVDRFNRTRLVAAGLALWSGMTAVCGLATSYTVLFIGRAGVGIGEATLSPAAFSLIANSFPKNRLALPLGIYTLGGATGAGLALIAGGLIYSRFATYGPLVILDTFVVQPWQATFLAAGLPGLVVAWLFLRLPEPPRPREATRTEASRGWAGLIAFYKRNYRLVIPHHLGAGFTNMASLGVTMWVGSFFSRVHGWSIAKTGLFAGVATVIAGVLGLCLAGWISDSLARSGRLSRLKLCVVTPPIGMAAALIYALASSGGVSAVMLCILLACTMLPFNIANAAYQPLLPDSIRGLASAVLLLVTSLLSSLGPIFVALMTDHVFVGDTGIRGALATFGVACFAFSGICFALALRPYRNATTALSEIPIEVAAS